MKEVSEQREAGAAEQLDAGVSQLADVDDSGFSRTISSPVRVRPCKSAAKSRSGTNKKEKNNEKWKQEPE